jgi:DNA-binding transcriptional ArsR family regulator
MKEHTDFENCAERLKALADPERLRIVQCLFEGPRTVGDISNQLGEELVNVSHHLAVLRRARILLARKAGRFVEYSIHPEVTLDSLNGSTRQINFGCCRVDLQ